MANFEFGLCYMGVFSFMFVGLLLFKASCEIPEGVACEIV